MPVTNAPPPVIFVPDDNNWYQLEEAFIIGGYTRTLRSTNSVRIRHVWTGGYYEYEPANDVDFQIFLPSGYNKIDARVIRGAGDASVFWS